ncbi:MAG: HlyD family efflux transporter periplasmic adaptor subunit, partial [Saprospiraceae bacterium]|nr:HlyD family efflux transporter periplasmic adaptor subunit [Saprospiraceae bacterium]
PLDGIVLFTYENLGEKQIVSKETEMMVVVPLEETETVGKVAVSLQGASKVREGQRVVVRMNSYPYPQFGALIGTVSWKGRVPNQGVIPVEVEFPQGLVTTSGRRIEPTREIFGEARIITENKRFIERVFERIRRATS